MTRSEFAMGSSIFVAVFVAGFLSVTSVDRHYAAAAAADKAESQAESAGPAGCVGADGSWKNWVWANVPMLSPKCAGDR
jgi:hypothetical protein